MKKLAFFTIPLFLGVTLAVALGKGPEAPLPQAPIRNPEAVQAEPVVPIAGTTTPVAPAAPQPQAPAPKRPTDYIIKSGDTISSIAHQFGLKVRTVLDANGLKATSLLKLGEKLVIPASDGAVSKPVQAKAVKSASVSRTKRSQPGSTSVQKGGRVTWASGALRELYRIPSFVRPTVKAKIENYARSHGIRLITASLYKSLRI